MYNDKELKDFDYWKIPRPQSFGHATDSLEKPISDNLRSLNARNWRQQGNTLIADTDWGELVQTIPVDYLLDGVENGLPTFKKVEYNNN
jgi:hypothetical protein